MLSAIRLLAAIMLSLLAGLDTALAAPRKAGGGAKAGAKPKAGGKQAKGGTKRKKRSAATSTSAAKAVILEGEVEDEDEDDEPDEAVAEPEPKKAPPPPEEEEEVAEEESTRPKSPGYEAMLADPSKIPDVHEEPAWAGFRKCMTSSCMGGDDQPDHVNCYRNVTFEQIFEECRAMIDDPEKEDAYMAYFKIPFLTAEKSAFCAEHFKGTYNETKDTCSVVVKFSRKYEAQKGVGFAKNDNKGCNNQGVPKTFSFGIASKKVLCSYETWNLDECHTDSPDLIKNQMAAISGLVQVATGAVAGVASGVSAGLSASAANKQKKMDSDIAARDSLNRQESYATPNGMSTLVEGGSASSTTSLNDRIGGGLDSYKADKGVAVVSGIASGLAGGGAMVTEGIGNLSLGLTGVKEKGGLYLGGKCTLPDESIVREGSIIHLHW
jgi:hypothetical protein